MHKDDNLGDMLSIGPNATGAASGLKLPQKVEQIEGIEPPRHHCGMDQRKTVPDILYQSLLGQPDATETDLVAASGNLSKVPLPQTYAISDTATREQYWRIYWYSLPKPLG